MNGTASYEIKNVNNVLSAEPPEFPFSAGLGSVVFEALKRNSDNTGQIDGVTGERETYGDIFKKSVRTAIRMRAGGVTSDDIVTLCTGNHTNTCIPIIASLFLDVKIANTDPQMSQTDTAHLLRQIRPKMIFVSPGAVELIEGALQEVGIASEIVVFGKTSKYANFAEFLTESEEESTFEPVEVDDLKKTAAIYFSSGTTGLPKGICLNHMGLLASTLPSMSIFGLPDAIVLSSSVTYWISSIVLLLYSILGGGSRVIVSDADTDRVWRLIKEYEVTVVFMSSSKVAKICQAGRPRDADTSTVRHLFFGGTSFTGEVIDLARKLFPTSHVFPGYGMTEFSGQIAGFVPAHGLDLELAVTKKTSSGQLFPGFSLKVVDVETEEILGPNRLGEIRLKSAFQMNGYHNQDASDQWDKDGFIKTGDLGYYDDDNYIYLTDRIKEIFKYQGRQISPVKLETLLKTHPAIEDAIVIGKPHPIDNAHPTAIVVIKKSHAGTIGTEEIVKYADERVDDIHKLRGGAKIVDRLETTPNGKYKRKYMKDLLLAGKI